MLKVKDMTPEQRRELFSQPLSEEEEEELLKIARDNSRLLSRYLCHRDELNLADKSVAIMDVNAKEFLKDIFGEWISAIKEAVNGMVCPMPQAKESKAIFKVYPEDDAILFIPQKPIVKARLLLNDKLLFFRENWSEQEAEGIPIEFVIENPTDDKAGWRFKGGIRWEIVPANTDGTP